MNVYGQLIRAQLENLASSPSAGLAGRVFFDTVQKKVFFDDGALIRAVGSGSGGSINYATNPDFEGSVQGWNTYNDTMTATVTIASPAVVTSVAHGLLTDDPVVLTTTGALPTGLTAATTYFVKKIDADTFKLAATLGGADINTSGTQSGVHTLHPLRPIDATGGTAVTTITRSTSAPLRDSASGLITKDAAIRAGEGVSTDLAIAKADQGQVLTVSMDFLGDANFQAGDLSVWVLDVTNGVRIAVAPSTIEVGATPFRGEFQTPTNSTSLRLCLHNASANGNATTVKIDNVQVGPSPKVQGTPITDWQEYTPTITGTTSNPTVGTTTIHKAKWRRVGDSMEIVYQLLQTSPGTDGVGAYCVSIPAGLSIDTAKMPISVGDIASGCGVASVTDEGSNYMVGVVVPRSSTSLQILGNKSVGGTNYWCDAYGALSLTNLGVFFQALIPILGWSSSVQMSSDADTRVVAVELALTSSFAATAGSPIIYDTVLDDSHGAYNPLTGEIRVPVTGRYRVSPTSYSAAAGYNLNVYIDGVINRRIYLAGAGDVRSGSQSFKVNAGSKITLVPDGTATFAGTAGGNDFLNSVSVERLSGPAQIAASETIAFSAGLTTGYAVSAGAAIIFDTVLDDSHGGYNASTGEYMLPSSGRYRVSSVFANATGAATIVIGKNGAQHLILATAPSGYNGGASATLKLNAGDKITIISANAVTLDGGSAPFNTHVSIERIGL